MRSISRYRRVEGSLLGFLVLLGRAADPAPGRAETPVAAPAPGIACTCRANGRSYTLGQRVCLATPEGFRLAECRMVQNVTSWSFTAEPCVTSALHPVRPHR
jgi:hypothetical protein